MTFEIVANNLNRKAEVKTLKLQNPEYAVTIFYYGDYAKDMESGHCITANLSMRTKPKGDGFPLYLAGENVVLSVPALPLVPVWQIEEFKRNLDIAGDAAAELQKVVKEYFGLEPTRG